MRPESGRLTRDLKSLLDLVTEDVAPRDEAPQRAGGCEEDGFPLAFRCGGDLGALPLQRVVATRVASRTGAIVGTARASVRL